MGPVAQLKRWRCMFLHWKGLFDVSDAFPKLSGHLACLEGPCRRVDKRWGGFCVHKATKAAQSREKAAGTSERFGNNKAGSTSLNGRCALLELEQISNKKRD